jgi:hypothetical protein
MQNQNNEDESHVSSIVTFNATDTSPKEPSPKAAKGR